MRKIALSSDVEEKKGGPTLNELDFMEAKKSHNTQTINASPSPHKFVVSAKENASRDTPSSKLLDNGN